jgi:hypothetical protein
VQWNLDCLRGLFCVFFFFFCFCFWEEFGVFLLFVFGSLEFFLFVSFCFCFIFEKKWVGLHVVTSVADFLL